MDQWPLVGPTVCRNDPAGCKTTAGLFEILQESARPTVANTVTFARRFEVACYTGLSLFKIFLCEKSPFRPRWRIPTLAKSRLVTAPWPSDLSLVKGSLRDPGTSPASASDFLAGNRYLRDLVAAFTEHPLKTFILAVRQLVMGMIFKRLFRFCFRSMTRSSSNPWRRRSSLDDAATRLSAWTGLIRNGKKLGLSIRSFSGAEPLARAWRDASASQAISRESSTASVVPPE